MQLSLLLWQVGAGQAQLVALIAKSAATRLAISDETLCGSSGTLEDFWGLTIEVPDCPSVAHSVS